MGSETLEMIERIQSYLNENNYQMASATIDEAKKLDDISSEQILRMRRLLDRRKELDISGSVISNSSIVMTDIASIENTINNITVSIENGTITEGNVSGFRALLDQLLEATENYEAAVSHLKSFKEQSIATSHPYSFMAGFVLGEKDSAKQEKLIAEMSWLFNDVIAGEKHRTELLYGDLECKKQQLFDLQMPEVKVKRGSRMFEMSDQGLDLHSARIDRIEPGASGSLEPWNISQRFGRKMLYLGNGAIGFAVLFLLGMLAIDTSRTLSLPPMLLVGLGITVVSYANYARLEVDATLYTLAAFAIAIIIYTFMWATDSFFESLYELFGTFIFAGGLGWVALALDMFYRDMAV